MGDEGRKRKLGEARKKIIAAADHLKKGGDLPKSGEVFRWGMCAKRRKFLASRVGGGMEEKSDTKRFQS